jgi:hypothetical protein
MPAPMPPRLILAYGTSARRVAIGAASAIEGGATGAEGASSPSPRASGGGCCKPISKAGIGTSKRGANRRTLRRRLTSRGQLDVTGSSVLLRLAEAAAASQPLLHRLCTRQREDVAAIALGQPGHIMGWPPCVPTGCCSTGETRIPSRSQYKRDDNECRSGGAPAPDLRYSVAAAAGFRGGTGIFIYPERFTIFLYSHTLAWAATHVAQPFWQLG